MAPINNMFLVHGVKPRSIQFQQELVVPGPEEQDHQITKCPAGQGLHGSSGNPSVLATWDSIEVCFVGGSTTKSSIYIKWINIASLLKKIWVSLIASPCFCGVCSFVPTFDGDVLRLWNQASGSADQTLKIWDVTDGSCASTRTKPWMIYLTLVSINRNNLVYLTLNAIKLFRVVSEHLKKYTVQHFLKSTELDIATGDDRFTCFGYPDAWHWT